MNRKDIKEIIKETRKRQHRINLYVICIVLITISAIASIVISIETRKNYYIKYDEKSSLDYKVYLKDNDYFGKYLGKDKQYIASLIDYIEADFNYKLSIDENIDYSYYYYIEAEPTVLDKNGKVLYSKKDIVLEKKKYSDVENHSFEIKEKYNLDYNKYNSLVNTFINRYKLTGVTSSVTLKMYVGIEGSCKGYEANLDDNAVISMTIPLTQSTVNVDINYKLNNGTNKLLECRRTTVADYKTLIIGIIIGIVDLFVIISFITYINATKSSLTIYNNKLNKIFNNYGRYITKIVRDMDYEGLRQVEVQTFEDLFEVRNSSQSPILFSQNYNKTTSTFTVPTNNGIVYIYKYNLNDVKEEFGNNWKQKDL